MTTIIYNFPQFERLVCSQMIFYERELECLLEHHGKQLHTKNFLSGGIFWGGLISFKQLNTALILFPGKVFRCELQNQLRIFRQS